MITIDELKAKLGGMKTAVDDLRDALSIEASEKRLAELEHQMTMPGFYDDQARSQKVISEMGEVKNKLERFGKLSTQYEEAETLLLMIEEENDPSLAAEGEEAVNGVEKSIDELQLMTMLNGEYDHNNAILTFHAGTGGTEAQDWAEMLYRMYTRWAERHGYTYKIMDYQDGDTAGIKSADILIEGENAYGFLKGESGVHPCTEEFIGAIRRLTEEHGALMICDEVQSGIFRTGLPYGFQNFGVLPDIVTMAKGIASGVVAGACAAKSSIAAAFAPGDHGTTFGGSNIAMATAHVTLSTLLAPGMGAQIESVGAYMRERLARLPHVQEVRGFGLMNGIDLTHEAPSAPDVVAAGLEAGLVLNATGPHTLRFLPPLICTEADVDVLVQKLEQLL